MLMLSILASCSQEPCSTPLSNDASLIDYFIHLEKNRCVHDQDIESIDRLMKQYHTQTTLHCDQVHRRSSMDGLNFDGPEELVLQSASVADVVIDSIGRHIIVYNDTTPNKFVETLQQNPDILWQRGLIGFGGLGLAVDTMSDAGLQTLSPNLHLDSPLELVDPDIGITADGQFRINFFAVKPSSMNRTQHGPMASAKPHHFYRTVSSSLLDFPTPDIIVSSSEGSNGGADPAILTRKDGSEILFIGPLDHTTMAWISVDGKTWPRFAPPTFNTRQRFATPDALADPEGGYRLYGMTNGRPGEFQVSLSNDGENYQQSTVVLKQNGAFNISVGVDPVGVWWVYYNKTDLKCVQEWGATKITPPSVQDHTQPVKR